MAVAPMSAILAKDATAVRPNKKRDRTGSLGVSLTRARTESKSAGFAIMLSISRGEGASAFTSIFAISSNFFFSNLRINNFQIQGRRRGRYGYKNLLTTRRTEFRARQAFIFTLDADHPVTSAISATLISSA